MPRGHPALDARSESHIVRGLSMALPYGYPKIPSASLLPQPIDNVTSFEAYGGPHAVAGDGSRLSQLEHRLRTDVQHSGQLFRRVYQASVRHTQIGHLERTHRAECRQIGVRGMRWMRRRAFCDFGLAVRTMAVNGVKGNAPRRSASPQVLRE